MLDGSFGVRDQEKKGWRRWLLKETRNEMQAAGLHRKKSLEETVFQGQEISLRTETGGKQVNFEN